MSKDTYDALKESYDSPQNAFLLRKDLRSYFDDYQFGISDGVVYIYEKSGAPDLTKPESDITLDLKPPLKDAPPRPDSDDTRRPESKKSPRSGSNKPRSGSKKPPRSSSDIPDLDPCLLDLQHKIGVLLNVAGGGREAPSSAIFVTEPYKPDQGYLSPFTPE